MSIVLRPYQIEAIDAVREAILAGHKRILLVIATGGGKTTVASEIITKTVEKGGKALFIAHRRELVDQAKNRLAQFGVYAGVIMAGTLPSRPKPVNVASVPTLTRRHDRRPKANVLIVDEAHHSTAMGFRRLIEAYVEDGAYVIGLTATPYRTDDRPLGDIYDAIVAPISLKMLTEEGHLVPARYFGPKVELGDIKVSKGDYDTTESYNAYNKRELYANTVGNYQRFAHGTKAICFNINVAHSLETVAFFRAAGYRAEHVDGETPAMERSRTLDAFRRGEIDVLCNVNILTEGFDLPAIETVILNRPTKSRGLYMQMVGRGLRPAPGKVWCTVIDQGNNVRAFGPVENEPEPVLQQPPKREKVQGVAPVKDCPQCETLVHLSATVCSNCGYVFPKEEKVLAEAEFTEITGGPVEVPEHLQKPWAHLTPEELSELGRLKGYKLGWVIRQAKNNNPGKEREALQAIADHRGYKSGFVTRNL